MEALERVAFEMCQTQSEGGIIYTEVHYVPHYFMPESFHNSSVHSRTKQGDGITIENIVVAINSGLARGQRRYNNVVVRSVLSLLRTKPEWSNSILDLAVELKDQGVVGIDMAGDILGITSAPNEGDVKNGI